MNRALNVMLGMLSLAWYSVTFPVLFDYLFINVSLEPVVGPCRETFGTDSCLPLLRVVLWFMELPINIVVFGSYALALVLMEKYARKIQLRYPWLISGVITGYMALILWPSESDVHFSYYWVSAITYSYIVMVGVWACRHLTSQSMAPPDGESDE